MNHSTHTSDTIDNPFLDGQNAIEDIGGDTLFKLLIVIVLLYLVWSDEWSIQLVQKTKHTEQLQPIAVSQQTALQTLEPVPFGVKLPASAKSHTAFYMDPSFAERHGIGAEETNRAQNACSGYIKRYAPVAEAEMTKFGIPASITLAQGLLESNAGQSRLATKTNNHFGIKCFSKKCKKGHCKNFTDDTHKDFFVAYPNIWGSFRAHSKFLKNGKRYNSLFQLNQNDYKAWARGLKKAGYATDPKYADKLIALIENLKLQRFDY